ncbi:phage anti-repressor protein [Bartonella japonica]|uniref:Phage anti-repressor protein n=1 Tax=Bartonella japonica TaxID=357761 RepID=A0ABV2FMW9_9HYPH
MSTLSRMSFNLVKPKGSRPSIEYHLTLDMAKKLSMVERNEKGRHARRYFI